MANADPKTATGPVNRFDNQSVWGVDMFDKDCDVVGAFSVDGYQVKEVLKEIEEEKLLAESWGESTEGWTYSIELFNHQRGPSGEYVAWESEDYDS